MKTKRKKTPEQTTRPPLTYDEKIWLFAALIRKQSLLERARELLKPEHFAEHEHWLRLIWTIADQHYEQFDATIEKGLLVTKINAVLSTSAEEDLPEGDEEHLDEFLQIAFDLSLNDLPENVAVELLRRYLEDQLCRHSREALSLPHTPLSLSSVFTELADAAASFSNLSASSLDQPFADGWDEVTRIGERRPTGISFLDYFLDGGQVRGESYGLLGPYGGGKSTIGLMISIEEARREFSRWKQSDFSGVPGRSYVFNYEEPLDQIRAKALSYLAFIPRKRVEEAMRTRNYNIFSAEAGEYGLSERTRFDWAKKVLNNCWRLVDMTGSDSNHPGRGTGLVDEIASIIRHDLSFSGGSRCLSVVVDYALAAIDAHLSSQGLDTSELRHYVNRFPLRMKRKIGKPFDCPTWSLHQLNTTANTFRPGQLPRHTDASEGRAFAENCDFCFIIGLPTRDGRSAFGCTKHRRAREMPPVVVSMRGETARVVDDRDNWSLDEHRMQIVPREEFESSYTSAGDSEVPAPSRGRNNNGSTSAVRPSSGSEQRRRVLRSTASVNGSGRNRDHE